MSDQMCCYIRTLSETPKDQMSKRHVINSSWKPLSQVVSHYAFWNLDINQLWVHLQTVNLSYIFAGIILSIYSVHIRAKRWQVLLKPLIEIPVYPLFSATVIGYFGNSVLPFRLGELLRGYSLSKEYPLKVSSIMGTIILDRILDFAGLLIISTLFLFIYPTKQWFKISC